MFVSKPEPESSPYHVRLSLTLSTCCFERPLQDGDIVNLDVSVYFDGMHADLNETFYVGKVSERAQHLVNVSRECLEKAIEIGTQNAKPCYAQAPRTPHAWSGSHVRVDSETGDGLPRAWQRHPKARRCGGRLGGAHLHRPRRSYVRRGRVWVMGSGQSAGRGGGGPRAEGGPVHARLIRTRWGFATSRLFHTTPNIPHYESTCRPCRFVRPGSMTTTLTRFRGSLETRREQGGWCDEGRARLHHRAHDQRRCAL